jgi:hypothetical protein
MLLHDLLSRLTLCREEFPLSQLAECDIESGAGKICYTNLHMSVYAYEATKETYHQHRYDCQGPRYCDKHHHQILLCLSIICGFLRIDSRLLPCELL